MNLQHYRQTFNKVNKNCIRIKVLQSIFNSKLDNNNNLHKIQTELTVLTVHYIQGDHSTDDVKFPDISLMVSSAPVHVKSDSYHAGTSVIVSGGGRHATVHDPITKKCTISAKSRMDTNMQLTINSFRPLFPDKIFSLKLHRQLSKSYISRFSRQLVTLYIKYWYYQATNDTVDKLTT